LLLVTFSFFLSFLFLWRMTTDQSYKSRATFDWGLTVGSHINRNLHSFTIFSWRKLFHSKWWRWSWSPSWSLPFWASTWWVIFILLPFIH
jgi:hypothetical protein